MPCYLVFTSLVRKYLRQYSVVEQEAREILQDIERQVGHNTELIKAVIDFEKAGLIKRLKKKRKEAVRAEAAYA